jgi:heme-degrading monooxygenase HmoA
MYGTVARMKIKPGAEDQLRRLSSDSESAQIPGFVSQQVYRLDADPNEYIIVVAFESKDSYLANAKSPEQHERFLQYRDLLAAEPEWHDGDIVSSYPAP